MLVLSNADAAMCYDDIAINFEKTGGEGGGGGDQKRFLELPQAMQRS